MEYGLIKDKIKNFNIENIIDDFILLCFMIGNDFLPRIYCFDIKKGNLDKLLEMYKKNLIKNNEYINHDGVINWIALNNLLK